MPKGDRTGPSGQGPGTGKALGYCFGSDTPGFTKGPGRGMGRGHGFGGGAAISGGFGWGRGRGFGAQHRGSAPVSGWPRALNREDEIKMLKNQAEALTRTQKDIEKRLDELEKE